MLLTIRESMHILDRTRKAFYGYRILLFLSADIYYALIIILYSAPGLSKRRLEAGFGSY
jgi:hypothetical protein